MFVAREIKQKVRRKFSEIFLFHPLVVVKSLFVRVLFQQTVLTALTQGKWGGSKYGKPC